MAIAEKPRITMDDLRQMTALSVQQVAEVLNVSKSSVYRLVEDGQLPTLPTMRTVRVSAPALVAILERADSRSEGRTL